MQLAGRDQRRNAAVHIVSDPGKRVLRRRILTDGGMRMGVNQTGNRGNSVGVNNAIGLAANGIADVFDQTIVDKDGIRRPQWILEIPGHQPADVFDQNRRHARTISKDWYNEKSRKNGAMGRLRKKLKLSFEKECRVVPKPGLQKNSKNYRLCK